MSIGAHGPGIAKPSGGRRNLRPQAALNLIAESKRAINHVGFVRQEQPGGFTVPRGHRFRRSHLVRGFILLQPDGKVLYCLLLSSGLPPWRTRMAMASMTLVCNIHPNLLGV